MVKPQDVWVEAACFNEQVLISVFINRVISVPGLERWVWIDAGSSVDTVT